MRYLDSPKTAVAVWTAVLVLFVCICLQTPAQQYIPPAGFGSTGATGATGPTGNSGGGSSGLTWWFNHPNDLFNLPTSTLTGVYAVNAATPAITRNDTGSGGSFITDGWQVGMQVAASGFTNAANNSTNSSWFLLSVSAGSLGLSSVSNTGCAGCSPAITAMVTEPAAAQTVTLTVDREGATNAPPTTAEVDENIQITSADGNVPIDTYVTQAAVPAAIFIPAGDWTINDWVYVNSLAGGSTTVCYYVLKISSAGVEAALFNTCGTPTTINQTSYQNVVQTYTVNNNIAILSTDRIGIRPTFNDGTVNPKIVHHVYAGNQHAGYILTSLPIVCSNCITNATGNINITGTPAAGQVPTATGSTGASWQYPLHVIDFSLDGGGAVVPTGDIGFYPTADFACSAITRIDISGAPTGSITVDVWKTNAAIPTAANKISASAPLTLSGAQLGQNGSLAGWTLPVAVNDVFGFNVATAATVTKVTGQVWCH